MRGLKNMFQLWRFRVIESLLYNVYNYENLPSEAYPVKPPKITRT